MANIKAFESKMTIFYSKSTNEIVSFSTGIQDMSFFGSLENDYSLIFDFIVVNFDEYIINNIANFCIRDGEVKLKQNTDLSKYM